MEIKSKRCDTVGNGRWGVDVVQKAGELQHERDELWRRSPEPVGREWKNRMLFRL